MTLREGPEAAEWWRASQEANPPSEPYGHRVQTFAEGWATRMEAEMAKGLTLAAVAERCEREEDTDGITGFMYGCAVGILSKVWVHGEELRRWHNLKKQIGDEGEKANEGDGVLNPALMGISRTKS